MSVVMDISKPLEFCIVNKIHNGSGYEFLKYTEMSVVMDISKPLEFCIGIYKIH